LKSLKHMRLQERYNVTNHLEAGIVSRCGLHVDLLFRGDPGREMPSRRRPAARPRDPGASFVNSISKGRRGTDVRK
jgi:hypothetical protein